MRGFRRSARSVLILLLLGSFAGRGGAAEAGDPASDTGIPAKLEKSTLTVHPRLDYTARDRLVESSLLAETGITRIQAQTVYNTVTDELGYRLGYGYMTRPFAVGFALFDRVEFKKEVGGATFIGRERLGGVELRSPLAGRADLRMSLFGGEYTTILSTSPKLVVHRQTVLQEWTFGVFPVDRGLRISFRQASPVFQADHRYQALEAEAGWRYPDTPHRWIVSVGGLAGALLRCRGEFPLYERYFIGGRATLPGWRLYEWSGESAVYGRTGLRIPVLEDLEPSGRKIWFSELSWITHFHAATAGDRRLLREGGAYRFSLTSGPRLGFTVPGGTQVHLQAEWCHPVHAGRSDVFYLSLGIS